VNALAFLTNVLVWGPTSVPEALETYDEILRQAGGDRRLQAHVARGRAVLLAMEGHSDEAAAEQERCLEIFRELGLPILVAESAQVGSFILAWGGNVAAAANLLAHAAADLESLKEQGYLSTHHAMLARYLVSLGRLDEAESEVVAARDMNQPDDLVTEIFWRSALAIVYSRRGDHEEADRLSSEAVGLVRTSDAWLTAEAFTAQAEVLAATGREAEAKMAMDRAIEIYRAKGATAVVERLEAARSA
jgi:tetratricopeptide (TPR) repeat protein